MIAYCEQLDLLVILHENGFTETDLQFVSEREASRLRTFGVAGSYDFVVVEYL